MKTLKRIMKVCIVIVALVGGIAYGINWYLFNIQSIHGHERLNESKSPNGRYTVIAYRNNGGATTSFAILGVLRNNQTGEKKNIYWQDHCDKADMKWLNEVTIEINGVVLNVKKDIYDFRKHEQRP